MNFAAHLPTARRDLRYHADAAQLFAHLGGLERTDTVLLESADIESKKNLLCLAVLDSAVRIRCQGSRVTAQALTATGEEIVAKLRTELSEYEVAGNSGGRGVAVFEFPVSQAADERERLLAISPAEVLRRLQLSKQYGSNANQHSSAQQGSATRNSATQGPITQDPATEVPDLPLLAGGFAYDFLETFETLPAVSEGDNTYPDYEFVVAETLLKVDHLSQTAYVCGVGTSQDDVDKRLAAYATKAEAEITPLAPPEQGVDKSQPLQVRTDIDDQQFRSHVEQLKGNIYQGDIYQVVPARTFRAPCVDAFSSYRRLLQTNPSPYMFYFRGEDYELFGASPESNLKFSPDTREVQLYPIAGTRPRGLNPDGSVNHELDIRNELEMRTDHKELAEHTMLVDLARNDLARVAVPGTRKVAELLQVDRYSRVMHLVSRVTATLHEDFDALDAYRACMNMGTLTGAPKLRAVDLLREVEGKRRGSYGGAVGYLGGDGRMDNCIVIRSAFVRHGEAIIQAGAGVVRDSTPQAEADETVHKAYAVLDAVALGAPVEVAR
ncbi:anthranilate synthase component 1 [Corynebacterium propinquum]|uniref:anthranilate synthase component 1 n=1 Tax=Corynebacterium propinquum TaxID=43769 RepID=UPI00254336D1|nr:anthranilate synthase component 1 [Corynebacterium propinquum]MDK4251902.1 anthranilate synthase component 1 [Corynebacterium propinquum]